MLNIVQATPDRVPVYHVLPGAETPSTRTAPGAEDARSATYQAASCKAGAGRRRRGSHRGYMSFYMDMNGVVVFSLEALGAGHTTCDV